MKHNRYGTSLSGRGYEFALPGEPWAGDGGFCRSPFDEMRGPSWFRFRTISVRRLRPFPLFSRNRFLL